VDEQDDLLLLMLMEADYECDIQEGRTEVGEAAAWLDWSEWERENLLGVVTCQTAWEEDRGDGLREWFRESLHASL